MSDFARIDATMADAVAEAEGVFRSAGFDLTGLVINVTVGIDGGEWAFGSRVPDRAPNLLGKSLLASAEEAGANVEGALGS